MTVESSVKHVNEFMRHLNINDIHIHKIFTKGGEGYITGVEVWISKNDPTGHMPEFEFEYSYRSETDHLQPKNRQKARYSHEERKSIKQLCYVLIKFLYHDQPHTRVEAGVL